MVEAEVGVRVRVMLRVGVKFEVGVRVMLMVGVGFIVVVRVLLETIRVITLRYCFGLGILPGLEG